MHECREYAAGRQDQSAVIGHGVDGPRHGALAGAGRLRCCRIDVSPEAVGRVSRHMAAVPRRRPAKRRKVRISSSPSSSMQPKPRQFCSASMGVPRRWRLVRSLSPLRTMAPDIARRLAARLQAMGPLYLDAPMSGGAARAEEGKLTMLASGSEAAFTAARPA